MRYLGSIYRINGRMNEWEERGSFLGPNYPLDDPRKLTHRVGALCWQEAAVLLQIK